MPNTTDTDKPVEDSSKDRVIKKNFDLSKSGMVQIKLSIFDRERPSPVDIFVPVFDKKKNATELNLICPKGESLKTAWWDELEAIGLKTICIKSQDVELLVNLLIQRAETVAEGFAVSQNERLKYFAEMGSLSVRLIWGEEARSREQLEIACSLASKTMGVLLRGRDILRNFAEVAKNSEDIFQHSMNVSLFAMVLGRRLGLSQAKLHVLGIGALLHDVGMSKVPTEIIVKKGKLTDDEVALLHKHPTWGHQILSLSNQVPYDALNIVLCHHERSDGKGYPGGLKGDSIPYLAKIVRVADIYDAMTSPKPYREKNPPFLAAQQVLKEASDNEEKEIVKEFIKMHKEEFANGIEPPVDS